jgi:hypothetical protein
VATLDTSVSWRKPQPVPDRALLERAAAGRDAVREYGADPASVLSRVVWPPETVLAAQEQEAEAHQKQAATR